MHLFLSIARNNLIVSEELMMDLRFCQQIYCYQEFSPKLRMTPGRAVPVMDWVGCYGFDTGRILPWDKPSELQMQQKRLWWLGAVSMLRTHHAHLCCLAGESFQSRCRHHLSPLREGCRGQGLESLCRLSGVLALLRMDTRRVHFAQILCR